MARRNETLEALRDAAIACDCFELGDLPPVLPPFDGDRVRWLGRAANGWFGVCGEGTASLDEATVIYADRQGIPPVAVTRSLPDFLSVLAFFPDFFEPTKMAAAEWSEAQAGIADKLADAETDAGYLAQALLALPGVRRLARGEDVVALLLPHERPAVPPEREAGQSLEQTRANIRAIEVRALRKLGRTEEEIAESLGIPVAELPPRS